MNGRHPRWSAVGAALAALGVALGLLVPLALAGSHHEKRAAAVQCTGVSGPTFPLELNTATIGGLVKSIAMEKEIFNCSNGGLTVVRDQETFVEVIEHEVAGPRLVTFPARVNSVTCDKTLGVGTVQCKNENITVTLKSAPPFIPADCSPSAPLPDPVEMDSVNVDDTWVKTVKVEKEIFSCNNATRIGDLYLFTELIELKSAAGDNFALPKATFVGVFCPKVKATGAIEAAGCTRFTPTPLP